MFIDDFLRKLANYCQEGAHQALDCSKKWSGYLIKVIRDIPGEMQKNPGTAIGVIAVANNAFFLANHIMANRLETLYASANASRAKRVVKNILINGAFVGGSTLGLNLLLSKVTDYSLNRSLLTALSVSAVAIRCIIKRHHIVSSKILLAQPKDAIAQQLENLANTKKLAHMIKKNFKTRKFGRAVQALIEERRKAKGEGSEAEWLQKRQEAIAAMEERRQKGAEDQENIPAAPAAPPLAPAFGEPEASLAPPSQEVMLPGESPEPSLPTWPARSRTADALKADIVNIKQYLVDLDAALSPVLQKIDLVNEQVNKLGELQSSVAKKDKQAKDNAAKIALLSDQETPYCHLAFTSNGKTINFLYYSDAEYEKIIRENPALAGQILKKSDFLRLLQKPQEEEEWDEDGDISDENKITKVKAHLEALKQPYEGIVFADLADIVMKRGEKRERWQKALVDYEKQLSEKESTLIGRALGVKPVKKVATLELSLELQAQNPELGRWLQDKQQDMSFDVIFKMLLMQKGLDNESGLLDKFTLIN